MFDYWIGINIVCLALDSSKNAALKHMPENYAGCLTQRSYNVICTGKGRYISVSG
jgi:hypothetical protein